MLNKEHPTHESVTLAEFFEASGRGSLTVAAKSVGTSKGYLSSLASGEMTCSGVFARRLKKHVEEAGFDLRAGPLCGLEDA
jgi:hypothetical protein